jgi:hypothetical protein
MLVAVVTRRRLRFLADLFAAEPLSADDLSQLSLRARVAPPSTTVSDSLSIIVPVRNAEASLASQVERLLELLPDLTPRFEIVIVDDASSDHTVDLARDLACEYPQLRLIRHSEPRGLDTSIKTGTQWAQGQTIFVQESPVALSATALRRLWSLRHERSQKRLDSTSGPTALDAGLLERLSTWGQSLRNRPRQETTGSLRIIHRAHIPAPEQSTARARADASHLKQPAKRRATTFLDHLRDLALGE